MMRALRDTALLFAYHLEAALRNPVWTATSLFQPACYLLLFAPLLRAIARSPGFPSGGVLQVFTPGLLVQLSIFGAGFVGFGLIADLRAGVLERLRVTPASRLSLLLGRVCRDVFVLLVQALMLVAVALPFGLSVSLAGLALTLALLILLGIVMSCCSYSLALALRNEDALASFLSTATLPVLLLSGILLPLSLAPLWLQTLADANPLAHAVTASRALFRGHLGAPSVLTAFVLLIMLSVLALAWATRSFQRAMS
jgi:ABC-2 type transport system permease protein